MNEYLKLVEKAQKKRIKITKKQVKNIRDLYRDAARDLGKRAKKANKDSLSERWLMNYQKQLKREIKELNKILREDIEDSMLESAKYANSIQLDFFDIMDIRWKLNSKETFSNMFSKIPKQAISELVNGNFYKDGKGLSKRLWNNEVKTNKDIDYIIERGLIEKKNVYDLAKDLEIYLDPTKKQDWDFKKIYPNIGNKKIEYNSFRLAVTSISHAYKLAMQRSCKVNPFCDGIQWHTSNSHRGPCSVCQSREGKIYKPDELPLDHPNGVCYFTPVITKSMNEVGKELHDWLYGKSNSKLDDWYKEYGREFARESNLFRNISKKDNNNNDNSSIIYNIENDLRNIGIKGQINIPPKNVDLKEISFDDNHINNERKHKVTREEALSYATNAKISISRWNGQFENYYSNHGATFIDVEKNKIRTSFKKEQFDDNVKSILEVLKKYGIN